jgi:hypothetical protein
MSVPVSLHPCDRGLDITPNLGASDALIFIVQGRAQVGIAKRMWEEEQSRGYSSVQDTYVCQRCVRDEGLRRFVAMHREPGVCSYCDRTVRVCPMDDVVGHVVQSLRLEWGDPSNEGLPYETREGGWQGDVHNIYELLWEVGLDCPDEVQDTIAEAILDTGWCKREPYSLSFDQTLLYGWRSFSQFIIHAARFVFYKAHNDSYDRDQHDEMNPVDILEALGTVVQKLKLTTVVPAGTKIYRVRIVSWKEMLRSAKDLGSPPADRATIPNRMSPVGIPMFYGAFDQDTAIQETYDPSRKGKLKAAAGEFSAARKLRVIDLSQTSFVPSLFDPKLQRLRPYYKFICDFISDFVKPIERSDRAHAEYVPTQVVTEYFRHVFRMDDGIPVDGIIYPSSKSGRKAIVVFADSDACVDAGEGESRGALLELTKAFDVSLKDYSKS